nr:hypothetical protein [Fodinicurvata fenggangensis]
MSCVPDGVQEALVADVSITLGGHDGRVPQELLDDHEVLTLLHEPCGPGVTHGVDHKALVVLEPHLSFRLVPEVSDAFDVKVPEEPGVHTRLEDLKGPVGQRDRPGLVCLGLPEMDPYALDVLSFNTTYLALPHPSVQRDPAEVSDVVGPVALQEVEELVLLIMGQPADAVGLFVLPLDSRELTEVPALLAPLQELVQGRQVPVDRGV